MSHILKHKFFSACPYWMLPVVSLEYKDKLKYLAFTSVYQSTNGLRCNLPLFLYVHCNFVVRYILTVYISLLQTDPDVDVEKFIIQRVNILFNEVKQTVHGQGVDLPVQHQSGLLRKFPTCSCSLYNLT